MATKIRILKETDFALQSKEKVVLQYDDVILVFFDDHSALADAMRPVFIQAGEVAAGPNYAICDLSVQDRVASVFTDIKSMPNNPFYWCGQPFPFILVYRSGWPQAFYNGDLDPELLRRYSMELAGQPTYREYDLNPRGNVPTVPVYNIPPGTNPAQNSPVVNIPVNNPAINPNGRQVTNRPPSNLNNVTPVNPTIARAQAQTPIVSSSLSPARGTDYSQPRTLPNVINTPTPTNTATSTRTVKPLTRGSLS